MRGTCPTCSFKVRFIQIGELDEPEFSVYMYPAPKLARRPTHDVVESEVFSGRVKKAYVEAICAYNGKHFTAAAVMCGRALEGITKSMLPVSSRPSSFYKQLNELREHIDIEKTIADLTDGIRKGRNIAAHFDDHYDIGEQEASLLLDLLESAIEYLFVLPQVIANLDERLNAEDASGDVEEE